MINFDVNEIEFEYLKLQIGAIYDHSHDKTLWQQKLNEHVFNTFKTIKNYLPRKCTRYLGIGSGLGVLECYLAAHYGGSPIKLGIREIYILDGTHDAPQMTKHAQTYSNMNVSQKFLTRNCNVQARYLSPINYTFGIKCELIISLQSWCFHYEPLIYLNSILPSCDKGTILILDIRKNKPLWHEQLKLALGEPKIIDEKQKYLRLAYTI